MLELGVFAAGVAPGGGASNVWAFLLGGDIDLSITMTLISSILCLGKLPTSINHIIISQIFSII